MLLLSAPINNRFNVVVRSLNPFGVGSKWLLAFLRVPVTPSTSLIQTIFSPCYPLNDRRRVARSLSNRSTVFFFSSCFSLARLFILILLLMSGNFYPNSDPVFFFSVCAGNMTWRGRSMQCCTCPKWVYLKCSLLSCSRFKTLSKLTPGATLLAAICMYTFSMSTSTV